MLLNAKRFGASDSLSDFESFLAWILQYPHFIDKAPADSKKLTFISISLSTCQNLRENSLLQISSLTINETTKKEVQSPFFIRGLT